ncbi:MAG: NADH pyrophosphatase zinc ribbon domain-containing protein [Acetobacteraceae bacterium]|nr:NADH pyrophosphatase zinc ribbon domain-containing protein [Acetobacteraceae bacterium]
MERAEAAFADLREAAGLLPGAEAAVLAHARALMHWRSRQRFCGACGGPCEPRSAGNVMLCTGCGASHFPRTDPAVIMLVTSRERGRGARASRAQSPLSERAPLLDPGRVRRARREP